MSKKVVYDEYTSIRIPKEAKELLDKIKKIKKSQGFEKYRLIDAVIDASTMLEKSLDEKK